MAYTAVFGSVFVDIKGFPFGKYLPTLGFQFPSQIVEMIASLILMILLLMIQRRKPGDHLYAWYMVLYGICRFCLNGFRYGLTPFVLGMSQGHFWSIVSVLIGGIWLIVSRRIMDRRKATARDAPV